MAAVWAIRGMNHRMRQRYRPRDWNQVVQRTPPTTQVLSDEVVVSPRISLFARSSTRTAT
jgi:hypothetical protein